MSIRFDEYFSARFWAKVRRGRGCWLWTGGLNHAQGYGRIRHSSGKCLLAHRVVWMLTRGPIPDGLDVLHECDHPSCVRPEHLYLGTDRDNALDRERKKRGVRRHGDAHWTRAHPELMPRGERHWSKRYPERRARGERQGSSKLSDDQVLDVRRRYDAGEKNKTALGRVFGITRQAIHYIVTRRGWRHVA